MKRRDFFSLSLGASASLLPFIARGQALPCPPTGFRIDGGNPLPDQSCVSSTAGFTTRPYFFQTDATRLKALISSNDPSATGSGSNVSGQPLGFITLMNSTMASRTANNDISAWNLAVAGWLTANTAMQDLAKAECLAFVRRNPSGATLSGDEYQHIEDVLMTTALIVDCCYARFTAQERAEVATFVNGALAYAEQQDQVFWPYGDPHNNYWNNRHLATCIGGLCTEGWNAQAATHRLKFEAMSEKLVQKFTAPFYTGPQVTEGHYYSAYICNSLWAIRQYDSVVGSKYTSRLSFTARDTLNLALFQLRPHNGRFFSIGSEAANSVAPFHTTTWNLWHELMFLASTSVEARVAKGILRTSNVTSDGENFWGRSSKGFSNFYWSTSAIAVATPATKTDRRLVLPTPGGAMTHFRSARGWDTATSGRAAIVFHSKTAWDGVDSPGYSHANVDQPGFQWAQDDQWLVLDPEVYGSSGIAAENGSSVSSDFSNIVTLASAKYVRDGAYPVCTYNEDNTGQSVPHYYMSINAQPYWTMCSGYRREYVWLDDLQVVLVFDRVTTSGSNTKTWRLNVDGAPSISGGVATLTTAKGVPLSIWDLHSTSSSGMSSVNLKGTGSVTGNVYQLRQTDAANDYVSVKVLAANNRASNVALTMPSSNEFRVTLTIGGAVRTVSVFASGTHAAVA